jgi:hypothetical protein
MLELPSGFRRFTQSDWMGYCGADKFPDGSEPIIGEIRILVDSQETYQRNHAADPGLLGWFCETTVEWVLSYDPNDTLLPILSGFTVGTESVYMQSFCSLKQALALLSLIRTCEPVSLALLERLGFSVIN